MASHYLSPTKLFGRVTPVPALKTGIMLNEDSKQYTTVELDELEGEIDLAQLDYSTCVGTETEQDWVKIETVLQRAGNAYGSLGFAAELLKAQDDGMEIFPVELRPHCIVMPRTKIKLENGNSFMPYFWWAGKWYLKWCWVDNGFHNTDRFVRPSEKKPAIA